MRSSPHLKHVQPVLLAGHVDRRQTKVVVVQVSPGPRLYQQLNCNNKQFVIPGIFSQNSVAHRALQRKSHLCNPRKVNARLLNFHIHVSVSNL
jgi:hypothetical protein